MPWQEIANIPKCTLALPRRGLANFFLLRNSDDTNWLIGQYRHLTQFATDLRGDQSMQDFLSVNQVRIGLRSTDVPPANIARQEKYGTRIRGQDCDRDFTQRRRAHVSRPVRAASTLPPNRLTDREQNVRTFWETQTPQSHHIVEFNNLEGLGISSRDGKRSMDYYQLPAVLLAAEFHQRYISAILKPSHHWKSAELETRIETVYSDLYEKRSELFKPIWLVSKIILARTKGKAFRI